MTVTLAEDHLPLASWVVSQMVAKMPRVPSATVDDLVSCANVALVECAGRYDSEAGASFATYAINRMRGAVLDELRRNDFASRSVRGDYRRLAAADESLSQELARTPTQQELADRLGMTVAHLHRLEQDVHRGLVLHLEGLLQGEHDGLQIELVDPGAGPEAVLIGREELRHLHLCIEQLPVPYGEVVRRHFLAEQTLTEIADHMRLSLGRLSQMRSRVLVLLRAALSAVWGLDCPPADGGIRARRELQEYVDRAVTACSPRVLEVAA
jgi:RNA polymerase sigma factor for flagellar operon FliA